MQQLGAQEQVEWHRVMASAMGTMSADDHRRFAAELSARASGTGSQYYRPKSAAELERLLNEGAQAGDARTTVEDVG